MPYVREGKCVYKKNSDGSRGAKAGCSETEAEAKKHMMALYAAENKSMAEFSMAITKASIPDKTNRTMRISMVNSDTGEDVYEERMSLELFNDFVERVEKDAPVPEPFIAVLNDGDWKGGMPYLSISHYKSGNGANVPGRPEKIYVDGEKLKSTAILHENSLGMAVWKSICQDLEERDKPLEERSYENPVRISIGFLDLEHKHEIEGEEEYIFTRSKLKETCPKCDSGINGKTYLKGQLVHLAFTRVPANPRTSVEVYRMGEEITTKKDDAKAIIGDLAEELVGKSTVEDDVLVIRADKDLEEYATSVKASFNKEFGPEPKPNFVTDKYLLVMDDVIYKVGYEEKEGEFTFDERSDWTEMQYGLMPKKSEATDDEWEVKFEDTSQKSKSEDNLEVTMEEKTKDDVQEVVEEEVVAPVKSTVEAATEKLMAQLSELREKGITGEAALKAVQPAFNELGKTVENQLVNPMEVSAEVTRNVVKEEIAASIPAIVAEIMKAIPANAPVQQKSEVPAPRSLVMERSARGVEQGEQLSEIQKIARASVGLQQ